MDGSAGTVGRIMASLLGLPPRFHADLGRLGVAFQLANFIRDVREDRRLDRIYLPEEDRELFGVTDADLSSDGPAVRALLAHEVERARVLFAAARPAIAAAPASVRPGVRLAVGLYERMLRGERPTGVRVWHISGRGVGGRTAVTASRPSRPDVKCACLASVPVVVVGAFDIPGPVRFWGSEDRLTPVVPSTFVEGHLQPGGSRASVELFMKFVKNSTLAAVRGRLDGRALTFAHPRPPPALKR